MIGELKALERLSKEKIALQLSPLAKSYFAEIDVRDRVESTNDCALDYLKQNANGGYICLAEGQRVGRGRNGKVWFSPYGANLYLSLAWNVNLPKFECSGLSLAVGVVIAEYLSALGIDHIKLKWPNDLVVSGHKLGGILIEMTNLNACGVVVGVGLNCSMDSVDRQEIEQGWTDLETCLRDNVSRNRLAADVINRLTVALQDFYKFGFEVFHHRWFKLDAFYNRLVVLETIDGSSNRGIARGINQKGELLIQKKNGLSAFSTGTLRPV